MSVRRMVAVLAVALCFGGIVAALAQPGKEGGALYALVAAFVSALAIAGVLALAGLALRAPRNAAIAAALVAGELYYFASCED